MLWYRWNKKKKINMWNVIIENENFILDVSLALKNVGTVAYFGYEMCFGHRLNTKK